MELTQLKYFMAVAEELHFGKAAKKLNMTQPPLSMQIKKLEEELEVSLFIRTNRSVSLTEEGVLFLKEVREILSRAENAVSSIKSFSESFKGPLKIGFNEPAINSFLPNLIKNFKKKYPDILISLNEMETASQVEALLKYRINIGFARVFEEKIPEIQKKLILSEKYLLVLPSKHRLLAFETITPKMLNGEPLIIFPKRLQPTLYDRIIKNLETEGYTPSIIQEAVTKQTTLALVEAGMGIAFIPESILWAKRRGVESRKFTGNMPDIKIYAIWHRNDKSLILKKFIDNINVRLK